MIRSELEIDYEILTDGTCSHCGRQAKLQELPDGDIDFRDECDYCDDYNRDLQLEADHEAYISGLWLDCRQSSIQ